MINLLGATALLLITIGARPALAQEAPPSERSLQSQEKNEQASPETTANSAPSNVPSQQAVQPEEMKKPGGAGSIVVAPLPISSPSVGSGIVPVVAYIFPLKAKTRFLRHRSWARLVSLPIWIHRTMVRVNGEAS